MLKTIKAKLVALIVGILVVALSGLSFICYGIVKQQTEGNLEKELLTNVGYSGHEITLLIEKYKKVTETVANSPLIISGDPGLALSQLQSETKEGKTFSVLTWANDKGVGVISNGQKADLSQRDYFRQVMATGDTYVGNPMISPVNGKPIAIIASPVKKDGKVIGIISGSITLESLSARLAETKIGKTGYMFMIQKEGLVLSHPDKEKIMKENILKENTIEPGLKAAIEKMSQGENGLAEYKSEGVEKYIAYVPVSGTDWSIGASINVTEVTQQIKTLTYVFAGVTIIFVLLAALIAVMLAGRIAKPIKKLDLAATQIAEGNFRINKINVNSQDELGNLAKAFEVMIAYLRSLITQVQSQADQVAATSEELTASTNQSADAANQVAASITEIAQGTEKQTASATHISAVAEQISASTEQISVTTSKVSEIAKNTSLEAEQGSLALEQAVDQMKQIGQGSEAVQTAIAELAQGSQEISEIVDLIATIAGQTNLLALNAAIEAARAGEHGRGFAVVAEEVRKLAEQSNQAAQRIGELIQKNQMNMEQAVAATQTGSEGVKAGVEVVNTAGETFRKIVGAIMKLSDQIEEISQSVSQMATGSRTLVTSIHEINKVSKENAAETQTVSAATEEQAASMQEIASSIQNLAKLAGDLQEAVAKFKV